MSWTKAGYVWATMVALAASVAVAQAPPVGDADPEMHGRDVSSYSYVDGRSLTELKDWQRDFADAVLTGDVSTAQAQLRELRTRSAEVNNLYYYLYYRSNPSGNAGGAIMPKFLHKVDQEVTLKMRNGRSYTGIVERVEYGTVHLRTRTTSYSGNEEEQILKVSWYYLAESEQASLLKQSNIQVDDSYWATLDYRNGKVDEAIERLSKQTDLFNRILLLRMTELKGQKKKVRVPKMFYSRAPQYRKNAMRGMRVPKIAESALQSYMELVVNTQEIAGHWTDTYSTDLAIALCFLADAEHPNSKTYGSSVSAALASIRPLNPDEQSVYIVASHAQVFGEAYAFTSASEYRIAQERAVDQLLRMQDANGWFYDRNEKPNMRDTACAVEALLLSYALGYKRGEIVTTFNKVRDAMRNAYDDKTQTMNLPIQTVWDKNIDDYEFLFTARLLGDVLHPYVRVAEQRVATAMKDFNPKRTSFLRYRTHMAEAASSIGVTVADDYRDRVMTPMLEQHNSGAWKTGYASETRKNAEHPNTALLIMGLWRYDWRELDTVAKEIKSRGR